MGHREQRGADGMQPDKVAGSCPVPQPVSRALRRWVKDHLRNMQRSQHCCRQVGHIHGMDVKHQSCLAICLQETWPLRQSSAQV